MTDQPRRILLVTWEGGGTVPPTLGVARRLVADGHRVHLLADPTVEEQAVGAGCSFSPWRRAPHRTSLDRDDDVIKDWQISNPLAMLSRIRDVMIAGPAADYAADTAEVIADFRPDVVAPDALLFGAIIGAQGAGVPVVPILPNIWVLPAKGTPALGPGLPLAAGPIGRARDTALTAVLNRLFRAGVPTLNAARESRGLPPLASFYDQVLETPRILVLSSPDFDFAAPAVPGHVRYVGPVLAEPDWAEPWTSPWPAENRDPLVLVGFSSTFQNQAPLLNRIVEAISALPVRAVVTLGQMLDDDEVASTANVQVVRSAPHRTILAEAALVVTHCGHGTTMKALAAGVPMVCIPMGRDQNDTAARVVHHGAGVRLSPKASAAKIRAAVRKVLADPRYRTGAERLAATIGTQDGAAGAARELAAFAQSANGTPRSGGVVTVD